MEKDSIVLLLVAAFIAYYFFFKTVEGFLNEYDETTSSSNRLSDSKINKDIYGYIVNTINRSLRPY